MSLKIQPADQHYLDAIYPKFEGWLLVDAAYFTAGLLTFQDTLGQSGPVLEIGVWKGKYLSLLHHKTNGRALGFDVFSHGNDEDKIYKAFEDVFGSRERLTLFRGDSTALSRESINAMVGGERMRFVSVDGSHEAAAVCHDIDLAESVLDAKGVVAIDDFLNCHAIGVSEGVYRYFITKNEGRLMPFAYCGNKLYACRAAMHQAYHDATRAFVADNPDLSICQTYTEQQANGHDWVDFNLLGTKCLVLAY